jgi:CspA family cold shock protein
MTIGTVKFFNAGKGFGFISPGGGGKDVFVHASAVEAAGLRVLSEGQRVNFDIQSDARLQGRVSIGCLIEWAATDRPILSHTGGRMTSTKQRGAPRSAEALSDAWERRTLLVKHELAAASAATDAKTARLKLLRLEKERQDAETAALAPQATKPAARRARAKRSTVE